MSTLDITGRRGNYGAESSTDPGLRFRASAETDIPDINTSTKIVFGQKIETQIINLQNTIIDFCKFDFLTLYPNLPPKIDQHAKQQLKWLHDYLCQGDFLNTPKELPILKTFVRNLKLVEQILSCAGAPDRNNILDRLVPTNRDPKTWGAREVLAFSFYLWSKLFYSNEFEPVVATPQKNLFENNK